MAHISFSNQLFNPPRSIFSDLENSGCNATRVHSMGNPRNHFFAESEGVPLSTRTIAPLNNDPVVEGYNLCSKGYVEKYVEDFPISLEEYRELSGSLHAEQGRSAEKLESFIENSKILEVIKEYQGLANREIISLQDYSLVALNYQEEYVDGVVFVKDLMKQKPEIIRNFLSQNLQHKDIDFVKNQRDRYKKWYGGRVWDFFYSFTSNYKFLDEIAFINDDIRNSLPNILRRIGEQAPELVRDLEAIGLEVDNLEKLIFHKVNQVNTSCIQFNSYLFKVLNWIGVNPKNLTRGVVSLAKRGVPALNEPQDRIIPDNENLFKKAFPITDNLVMREPHELEKLNNAVLKILEKHILKAIDNQWAVRKVDRFNPIGENITPVQVAKDQSVFSKVVDRLERQVVVGSTRVGVGLAKSAAKVFVHAKYYYYGTNS